MLIESMILSNYLILCHPFSFCLQFFPALESFPVSWLFASTGQSIGASASVLPKNNQGWFPLGMTGLNSLQSKGLSRFLHHHNWKASIIQHIAFFIVQLSHLYLTIGKKPYFWLTIWNFISKGTFLLFHLPSRFVIIFLPRSMGLLISWLQLPSVVILEPNKR